MPEPTSTAIITLGGAAVASTALTVLGVPLGLRADVLVAIQAGERLMPTMAEFVAELPTLEWSA